MQNPVLIKNYPTIMEFNNIPYLWRGTNPSVGLDCFSLYNYIIYRHEKRIITGFDWVKDVYNTELESPKTLVKEEMFKLFGETPNGHGMALDMVLINWFGRYGIGTVLMYQGNKYIVHTGKGVSNFTRFERLVTRIEGCWNTRFWSKKVKDFYGHKI